MKRKIMIILLVILTCLAIYIICLKFKLINVEQVQKIEDSDMVIDKDKKILSVWNSWEREVYTNGISVKEDMIVSLVFYDNTVDVCIKDYNVCEELSYIKTDEYIDITKSDNIMFSGRFNIIESDNITMILEKVDDNNKVIYYFYRPAG